MTNWFLPLGYALAAAGALMITLWFVQRRSGNAGIVDVGWALGIGALVAVLAWAAPGDPLRRLLVAGLTGIWAVRLGAHVWQRVRTEPEDGRYRNLRAWAGPRQQPVLLGFFLLQATWVVLFALPQYVALWNPRPLGWLDGLAVLVFAISLIGEATADQQLARFRAAPENRGEVCRAGLWRYSRHPNYFFEWLHWFTYPLLALGVGPTFWLALAGPLVMLVFLLWVTGIPPTEARAIQSRGERYRAYQRTTSAFFPWFPREDTA